MNKTNSMRSIALILMVLFIAISGCEDKNKIRAEIKLIESKILAIDKAISYLIMQKRGDNTISVYPIYPGLNRSISDRMMQELINEYAMKGNREIDAKINELKGRREILMLKLKTLIEKL